MTGAAAPKTTQPPRVTQAAAEGSPYRSMGSAGGGAPPAVRSGTTAAPPPTRPAASAVRPATAAPGRYTKPASDEAVTTPPRPSSYAAPAAERRAAPSAPVATRVTSSATTPVRPTGVRSTAAPTTPTGRPERGAPAVRPNVQAAFDRFDQSTLEFLEESHFKPTIEFVGGVLVVKLDHSKMYRDEYREKVIRWMEDFSKAVPDDLVAPMKMLDK